MSSSHRNSSSALIRSGKCFISTSQLSFAAVTRRSALVSTIWGTTIYSSSPHIDTTIELRRDPRRAKVRALVRGANRTVPDVFVSYSSTDRARVAPLVEAIERRGWTVWWDRKIDAGTAFDREIESAHRRAKCIVVVWSAQSVDSRLGAQRGDRGARPRHPRARRHRRGASAARVPPHADHRSRVAGHVGRSARRGDPTLLPGRRSRQPRRVAVHRSQSPKSRA